VSHWSLVGETNGGQGTPGKATFVGGGGKGKQGKDRRQIAAHHEGEKTNKLSENNIITEQPKVAVLGGETQKNQRSS